MHQVATDLFPTDGADHRNLLSFHQAECSLIRTGIVGAQGCVHARIQYN